MRARNLVLLALFACSKSANPPPPSSAAAALVVPAVDATQPDVAAPPAWGVSVRDPKAEREAMELFASVASGKAKPEAVLAPVFAIGPGLWSLLAKSDAAFAKLGTPSKAALSATDLLDMRSYLEPMDRKAVVISRPLIGLATLTMRGGPRAATDAERRLFYALSPIEIVGRPVTVIDTDRVSILVYAEDGKLTWIDAPSAYFSKKP